MVDTPEEKPKPRPNLNYTAVACTCIKMDGRRLTEDPMCPVTFHNDQVDSIFEERGYYTNPLEDHDHGYPPNLKENPPNV